jgi:hypothetical protein
MKRGTRRNLSTQPIQGSRAKPAKVKHEPISPDELAEIVEHARLTRIEIDIAEYGRRKAS